LNWTGKRKKFGNEFLCFHECLGSIAHHNLTAHHRSPSPTPHPSLYTLNSLIHLFILHLLTFFLNFSSSLSSSSTNTTTHCTNPLWNTHSYLILPINYLLLKIIPSRHWFKLVADSCAICRICFTIFVSWFTTLFPNNSNGIGFYPFLKSVGRLWP
jgi:hypothetical protein